MSTLFMNPLIDSGKRYADELFVTHSEMRVGDARNFVGVSNAGDVQDAIAEAWEAGRRFAAEARQRDAACRP